MCTPRGIRKYQLQNTYEQSKNVRWFTARSLLKDCRALVGFYSFCSKSYKKIYSSNEPKEHTIHTDSGNQIKNKSKHTPQRDIL